VIVWLGRHVDERGFGFADILKRVKYALRNCDKRPIAFAYCKDIQ
jgi:hypothetical protein